MQVEARSRSAGCNGYFALRLRSAQGEDFYEF